MATDRCKDCGTPKDSHLLNYGLCSPCYYKQDLRKKDKRITELEVELNICSEATYGHLVEFKQMIESLEQRLKPRTWQPIETAPEDEPVEFYNSCNGIADRWIGVLNIVAGEYIYGEPYYYDGWNAIDPDIKEHYHPKPTHWKPLTTAPEDKT
jgi:hypothetical protein